MGMMPTRSSEKNEELQAEKREQDFIRDRDALAAIAGDESENVRDNRDLGDLTIWQQNLGEEVENWVHNLRREIKIEGKWHKQQYLIGYDDNKQPIYESLTPMINEEGIRTSVSMVSPLISRNLIMSNYSEDRLLLKIKRVVKSYIIHLASNYKHYAIKKSDLSAIVQMFRDIVEPAHFRSMNNGERRYLTTTTKRLEQHTPTPVAQKKGWGMFN